MKSENLMVVGNALVGLGVCGAVGAACYVTKKATPLLGLVFLPAIRITVSTDK